MMANLSDDTQADSDMQVGELWQDLDKLEGISKAAIIKGQSWTEASNASALLCLLDRTIPNTSSS